VKRAAFGSVFSADFEGEGCGFAEVCGVAEGFGSSSGLEETFFG